MNILNKNKIHVVKRSETNTVKRLDARVTTTAYEKKVKLPSNSIVITMLSEYHLEGEEALDNVKQKFKFSTIIARKNRWQNVN